MGFRLKVTGGADPISFDERAITSVVFSSETPKDSNARATDYGMSVQIRGKMLYFLGAADADQTLGLAQWSQVPSHKANCYRNLEIEVVSASQVVRKITLPQAFVMEYTEELDDENGVGTFYLHAKEKKDENRLVKIEGGFGVAN
jgi:hypothetical protein